METQIRSQDIKDSVASELVRLFEENEGEYRIAEAVLHYEFPVYRDEEDGVVSAKVLLLSPNHGVLLFSTSKDSQSSLVNILATTSVSLDQVSSQIAARLLKNKSLRKSSTQIGVPINVALYAPLLSSSKSPVSSDVTVLSSRRALDQFMKERAVPRLADKVFSELIATVEGAKGLIRPKKRDLQNQPDTSKGRQAEKVESEIAIFDRRQIRAYADPIEGPQRIRGLAGSGKTIILAMKAALTHLRHPEAKILYTFATKSLYQLIQRMITRFYREFDDRDPDLENRIRILHAWGGNASPGVYYETCIHHDRPFLSYSDASRLSFSNPFDYACTQLLDKTKIETRYDYVFVDEGQDFPASFLQLCFRLARGGKFVWAYDELQTIFQAETPPAEEVIGKSTLHRDVVLYRCYRNPREILVCAHALGFGIYDGIVQMIRKKEDWEAIGYKLMKGQLRPGEEVILERPVENSLQTISDNSGINEIVKVEVHQDVDQEVSAVAKSIVRDIKEEGLRPDDILVISADDRFARNYLDKVSRRLQKDGIKTNNMHSDVYAIKAFQEDGHVTLATVHKAKGNESFMVYILGVDSIFRKPNIRSRNMIFSAMTRAKGWVRLSGVGSPAEICEKEMQQAKGHFPNLVFEYPSAEQIRMMEMRSEESLRIQQSERVLDQMLSQLSIDELEDLLEKRRQSEQGLKRTARKKGDKDKQ